MEFESIINAARSGDRAARDRLCAQLYPRVERLVHRSLTNDIRRKRPWLSTLFSTGDVVQDVFLGVLNDLGEIRCHSESALLHYIATLTRNRLIDAIRFYEASRRDRRRLDDKPLKCVEQDGAGPEDHAITHEEIAAIHQVLASFSERDRTLLRERIENRKSFEQLAKMLGYHSGDTTRKAFHVAQARLMIRLGSA